MKTEKKIQKYIKKKETIFIKNTNNTTITGNLEKIDHEYIYLSNAFFNEDREITYDINLRKKDIKVITHKTHRYECIDLICCSEGTLCVNGRDEMGVIYKFASDFKSRIVSFFLKIDDFFRGKKCKNRK
ncbi:hypothetical protein COBT_000824 [Conglomerata obtusa]